MNVSVKVIKVKERYREQDYFFGRLLKLFSTARSWIARGGMRLKKLTGTRCHAKGSTDCIVR